MTNEGSIPDVSAGQVLSLEHLIYTWADTTITGPGFGVVAHSESWPIRSDHNQGGLGGQVEFLRQGSASKIRQGAAAPEAVTYRIDENLGRMLLVKTYLGQDSHGRDGRYLVHALVDRSNTLNPLSALAVAESSAVQRSWPLDAPPTGQLPPIVRNFSSSHHARLRSSDQRFTELVVEAVLDYIASGVRSVFLVENAISVVPILAAAFATIPGPLLQNITFSTFDSNPGSCPDALIFASPDFSDCRTLQADQTLKHLSDGCPASASDHGLLSRTLVGRPLQTQEALNSGPSTISELLRLVRRDQAFAKPIDLTTPQDTSELLASPMATRWLTRPGALQAVLRAVTSPHAAPKDLFESLRPDLFTEPQLAELHDGLLHKLTASAGDAWGHTAISQAFYKLGGTSQQLENAIWEARVLPQILQRNITIEAVRQNSKLLECRLTDAPDEIFEAASECVAIVKYMEYSWNTFNHRLILRTWHDPIFAEKYQAQIHPLYGKYSGLIADVLSIELLKVPSPATWAGRLQALPRNQRAAMLHLLSEYSTLRPGWLFDLLRSPSCTRETAVGILSMHSKRILQEENIAVHDPVVAASKKLESDHTWHDRGRDLLLLCLGMITGAMLLAAEIGYIIPFIGLLVLLTYVVAARRQKRLRVRGAQKSPESRRKRFLIRRPRRAFRKATLPERFGIGHRGNRVKGFIDGDLKIHAPMAYRRDDSGGPAQ